MLPSPYSRSDRRMVESINRRFERALNIARCLVNILVISELVKILPESGAAGEEPSSAPGGTHDGRA